MKYLNTEIIQYTIIIIFICTLIISTIREILLCNKKINIYSYTISDKLYIIKQVLLYIGIIFLLLSVIGSEINLFTIGNKKNTYNISFVVDISKSMDVQDINKGGTSRLDFAKKIIKTYIIDNPQNQYSLVVFSGKALQISPLTDNIDWIISNIESINSSYIKNGGTNIKEAIKEVMGEINNSNDKNIIIISDGEELINNNDFEYLNQYKNKNIKLFTIGIGTEIGGYIPVGTDIFGNTLFKNYNQKRVISRLDEDTLKTIANIGNGKYLKGNNENIIKKIEDKFLIKKQNMNVENNFKSAYFFILISFILMIISYIINEKINKGKK